VPLAFGLTLLVRVLTSFAGGLRAGG